MPDIDLRTFIRRCEAAGELNRIAEPIDPMEEMGAVARQSIVRAGPANRALLCEQVVGYPGQRSLLNLFTNRARCYLALETDDDRFSDEYGRRTQQPIPVRRVATGACQEVVAPAGEASLLDFPVTKWHGDDAGRFITAGCCISRDPETGRGNVGIYRHQVHGDDEVGILAAPYRGVTIHARKAWARGERLPVAIVIGPDPVVFWTAAAEWPQGVDELEMAGGLRREPVDVVRCVSVPLEVPATAEIVIEGEMDPQWRRPEGPFGEFTGYYGGGAPQPYIKVRAITHRRHPIYDAATEGQPPSTSNVILSLQLEAEIRRMVTVPGLLRVCVTPGSSRMIAIVRIRKQYEGHGKAMGLSVLGVPAARMVKTVIVVDEDVDPFDWTQVEWALATRFQPERDVEILKDMLGSILDPSLPAIERERRTSRTSKLVLDATQPLGADYPPKCGFDPAVVERVLQKWARFGLPY